MLRLNMASATTAIGKRFWTLGAQKTSLLMYGTQVFVTQVFTDEGLLAANALINSSTIVFKDGCFVGQRTERNAIDTMLPNKREIFVPFGSIGGYRRSFSRKLQLSFSIES
uniref:Uncharacterized protein n=1 Tax=Romanomermis culicivorax TaxID=13658 RepID=A0A915HMF1_ROMCU